MSTACLKRLILVLLVLPAVLSSQVFLIVPPALAQLKGGVTQDLMLPAEDPFGQPGGGDEMSQQDAPPQWGRQPGRAQAAMPAAPPPPPQRTFGLSLEETGLPEEAQEPPPKMAPQQAKAAPANPDDPDSTPEMQLLWDAWHRRVAGEIFTRFNMFAKAAFRFSKPLRAVVTYRVTRDGKVENVQLAQSSTNLFFNLLITQVVKSLNGNAALLQFPPGSRRQVVDKSGVFAQNVGRAGFRHQTGDAERIQGAVR